MKNPVVMLSVLAALACPTGPARAQETPSTITLTLPSLSWAVEVPAAGFRMERPRMNASLESRSAMATQKQTGVSLSVFLEKAPAPGGVRECREHYWSRAKQSPVPKEQIRLSESGDTAIVEYLVPEWMGMKVEQKHMNVYMAHEGYWIDVHLSKALFKPGDEKLFEDIVKEIRIHRDYVPTPMDLIGFAMVHYARREYARAVPFYEKALEQEKAKPTLDRRVWKYLVDQLGMSYGLSGDLAKAKALYEWGIQQEPEYPVFYYNLACTHAEMGDKEQALRNLKLAFQHKQNVLPGERLANPSRDSSFREYMSDPAFAAEVENLK